MNIYEFMSANPWLTFWIVACITVMVVGGAEAIGSAIGQRKE